MITVAEADRIIAENITVFPAVEVSLREAFGFILREDIFADRDLPPFHKALMDGIAVQMESYDKGNRSFKIEGTQKAGSDALHLSGKDACIEIMTGAMLSRGCDCVIPSEQVTIRDGNAVVNDRLPLEKMQNVRPQGADHEKGSKLLSQGCLLLPPQIAVAASVGKATVKVSAKPKVAIVSTGDELVEIDADIKPYQIRKSNSLFMQAALERSGLFKTGVFHFRDDKEILRKEIDVILNGFDVLLFTGGVSVGKFDYIPQVLKELGAKVLFHKVRQKPGKPFWFGQSRNGRPIFALPGNPVSTQIGMYRYVLPHLKRKLGLGWSAESAILGEDFAPDTKFVFFLTVKVNFNSSAQLQAQPIVTGGSGDFATLGHSDGFLELPCEQEIIKKGFVGSFYRWN